MARNKGKSKISQRQGTSAAAAKTNSNPYTPPAESLTDLLATATTLLRTQCAPSPALTVITRAISLSPSSLPALELAGECHLELGDTPTARTFFLRAAELDPHGLHEDQGGSGPEKFLWLAQLSEEGGREAVGWFERGVNVLRKWIQEVEEGNSKEKGEVMEERGLKGKLCSALCGMAEIYMTDLCMEPTAESSCETYVTEALLLSPDSAEALQTLASIRISQLRIDDAKAALERSVELWVDLEPGSSQIPSYATRMATTRLLMETELYDLAFEVLEGLRDEDDHVVDLWYLGGWCLYCKGETLREAGEKEEEKEGKEGKGKGKEVVMRKGKEGENGENEEEEDAWQALWGAAREWLNNCARLYRALDWEDERLKDHVVELLAKITEVLGEEMDDDEEEEDDDDGDEGEEGEGREWEDAESDGDEEMKDS